VIWDISFLTTSFLIWQVIWDISQNIHLVQPLNRPGISCCITPGGKNFLSSLGRPMLGYEKLLLQGIPPDRLLLGRETEVQLSDLAGNAMSMPVVSAAVLAALVVGAYCRQLGSKGSDSSVASDPEKLLASMNKSLTGAANGGAAESAKQGGLKPRLAPKAAAGDSSLLEVLHGLASDTMLLDRAEASSVRRARR